MVIPKWEGDKIKNSSLPFKGRVRVGMVLKIPSP